MTKEHCIALADALRPLNLTEPQLERIADWCAQENRNFMRGRWLAYVKGECGRSGGAIPKK